MFLTYRGVATICSLKQEWPIIVFLLTEEWLQPLHFKWCRRPVSRCARVSETHTASRCARVIETHPVSRYARVRETHPVCRRARVTETYPKVDVPVLRKSTPLVDVPRL